MSALHSFLGNQDDVSYPALLASVETFSSVLSCGNQDLCLSLNFKGDRSGLFHDHTANEHAIVEVFTDADWASCKDDRRSSSACAIFCGGCLLHSSRRTQKIVSLSSAESEMYAAASGTCDSVLIVGILKRMFDAFSQIHLFLDSAAARGIINRRGVGKIRHLSCRSLWLQERMADGSLVVSPVPGLTNPADIGTKRLNVNRMKASMFLLGMFDSVNSCHVGETEVRRVEKLCNRHIQLFIIKKLEKLCNLLEDS